MNPHSYRLKGRDFVHQGKIEIDVNERAVFIRTQGCFFVYTNSDCFLNSLLLKSYHIFKHISIPIVSAHLLHCLSACFCNQHPVNLLLHCFLSSCFPKGLQRSCLKALSPLQIVPSTIWRNAISLGNGCRP